MYVAVVPNRDSPPAILLRESYRQAGKVKTRTLANLSQWPPERIDRLRILLSGKVDDPPRSFEIIRSLPHGHVAAVIGTIRKLDLARLISRKDPNVAALCRIVSGRGARPATPRRRRFVPSDGRSAQTATTDRTGSGPQAPQRGIVGSLRRELDLVRASTLCARKIWSLTRRQEGSAADCLCSDDQSGRLPCGHRGIRGQYGGSQNTRSADREARQAVWALQGDSGRRPRNDHRGARSRRAAPNPGARLDYRPARACHSDSCGDGRDSVVAL